MNYQEDTVLQIFKEYLEKQGYSVLSASGKQQGLYRFSIGTARKGPDIVAAKDNIMLVGEGKKRSAELLKMDTRGISDYNSLQYILDHPEAQAQIVNCIPGNLSGIAKKQYKFLACVVGSTSYANCLQCFVDDRIFVYRVDVKQQKVIKEK